MTVLAVALILASTQCLAQCVVQPCHESVTAEDSVPPCHRHQPQKQTSQPESCKYLVLVSDNRAPSVASMDLQRFDFSAAATAPPLALMHDIGRPVDQNISPPTSVNIALFTVLRV